MTQLLTLGVTYDVLLGKTPILQTREGLSDILI